MSYLKYTMPRIASKIGCAYLSAFRKSVKLVRMRSFENLNFVALDSRLETPYILCTWNLLTSLFAPIPWRQRKRILEVVCDYLR